MPGGLILRRDRGLRPTSTPIIDSPLRQVRDRKMWQEMVEPFEKNYVLGEIGVVDGSSGTYRFRNKGGAAEVWLPH